MNVKDSYDFGSGAGCSPFCGTEVSSFYLKSLWFIYVEHGWANGTDIVVGLVFALAIILQTP